jgi:hypothetical protein
MKPLLTPTGPSCRFTQGLPDFIGKLPSMPASQMDPVTRITYPFQRLNHAQLDQLVNHQLCDPFISTDVRRDLGKTYLSLPRHPVGELP